MLEQAGMPGPLAPAGGVVPPPRVSAERPETPAPGLPAPAPVGHPTPPPAEWYTEAPHYSRVERLAIAAWTKPGWLAPLAVLGCVGAACTYVLQNDPTDARLDPLGPCAFKLLTGLDCPGCGGTRMVWYLLHGNLYQAARFHLIALIAAPILAYAYVVWAARRVSGVRLPSRSIPLTVVLGYLVVWIVFSVLRDLPWEPFTWFFVS